jgi:hypothetical protein
LLVVGVSAVTTPQGIFTISAALLVAAAVLALAVLKEPRHIVIERGNLAWQVSAGRVLAAQVALRRVVLRARTARQARTFAQLVTD